MTEHTATHTDDAHRYVWDGAEPAELVFERLTESKRDVTAEITASTSLHDIGRIYGPVRVNLISDRSLKTFANNLTETTDIIPWVKYLSDAAHEAVNWLREGDPPEAVDIATTYRTTWALEPFCETDGYTVIFARGGSGKSLLAATFGLSVATGTDLVGTGPPQIEGPVLYLDWEASKDVLDWRLARLCSPLGISDPPIYYRREAGPLASMARAIARHIRRLGIRLLIVDSKGLAITGAPESSEGILELARALRALDTPTILIDHVSKGAIKGDDPNMAFGSQYVEAASRQAWSVSSELATGGISLRLSNTKANNGAKHPAVGLAYMFDDDEIHILGSDPERHRARTERASTGDAGAAGPTTEERIIDLLAINPGDYTIKDVATILDASYEATKKAITRSPRLKYDAGARAVIDSGQESLPDPW